MILLVDDVINLMPLRMHLIVEYWEKPTSSSIPVIKPKTVIPPSFEERHGLFFVFHYK